MYAKDPFSSMREGGRGGRGGRAEHGLDRGGDDTMTNATRVWVTLGHPMQ